MWQGSVVSISIAPGESDATRLVDEVRAISGRGLEGDRYCRAQGEAWEDPGKEITLIASEAIDAMAQ
ncbi:MAG: MOSC domain-containing protein, partial [Dehalococcoidia bacterium]